jgi:hypothetical protein
MSVYIALVRVKEASAALEEAIAKDSDTAVETGFTVTHETKPALQRLQWAALEAQRLIDEEAGGEA